MGRPSFRDFLKNFDEYDAPIDRKVSKAVRNNLKKLTTWSECCGHHGEPGC
jgi:hypothetical protein